jgi:hypothetical protein
VWTSQFLLVQTLFHLIRQGLMQARARIALGRHNRINGRWILAQFQAQFLNAMQANMKGSARAIL